jgi:EAL domain-containing protein (putative c-di-GMP-specific phosphodiesterase class I)
LIVTKIENEPALAGVLDFHVKLGQGYLFSEPRGR